MAAPIAHLKTKKISRTALLAGTMMSVMAAAPSMAADETAAAAPQGAIVLAQAGAIDPQQKAKGPPPKGQPPAGIQRAMPPGQPKGVQVQQPIQQQPPQQQQQQRGFGQPKAPPQQQQQPAVQQMPPQQQRQFGGPKGPQQQPAQMQQPQTQQPVQTQQPQQKQQPPMRQVAPPPGAPKGVQPAQVPGTPKGQQPAQMQPGLPKGQQPAQMQPGLPKGPQQPGFGQPPQPPQQQPAQIQPPQRQLPPGIQPGGPVQTQQHPPGSPAVPPRQFGQPGPGLPPPPQAAGITPMRGNVDLLRSNRVEHRENNGRIIIQEPGGRVIVRDGGRAFIRHDETERFRHFGAPRFEERGHERFAYVARPGGYQIITVTGPDGRMLRRIRRGPDGREVVLVNNAVVGAAVATGFILALAAPQILIPRERYIVDVAAAPPAMLYETFNAPPVVPIERAYALDEIRYNVNLRDRVRRVDLTSITFDSGSWELSPEQFPRLEAVANGLRQVLASNPDAVFMVEGHTDAVGADVDNLSLSDRRAESVAVALTEQFQIPPENLVTQGYGEQFPKVPVDGPSRENRRVAIRNISPLLAGK